MFKAASELSTQIDRAPYVSDNENSAFCARFGLPAYAYYEQNPQKAARFKQSMDAWSKCESIPDCPLSMNRLLPTLVLEQVSI